jgi:hypothetical protein
MENNNFLLENSGALAMWASIFIALYCVYCAMNMQISEECKREYKWKTIISFSLYLIDMAYIIIFHGLFIKSI